MTACVRFQINKSLTSKQKYRNAKCQLRKSIRIDRIQRMSNSRVDIQQNFINKDFGEGWKLAKRWYKHHVGEIFQVSEDFLDIIVIEQRENFKVQDYQELFFNMGTKPREIQKNMPNENEIINST